MGVKKLINYYRKEVENIALSEYEKITNNSFNGKIIWKKPHKTGLGRTIYSENKFSSSSSITILLYSNNFFSEDLLTLIHELGHSRRHFYVECKNKEIANSKYKPLDDKIMYFSRILDEGLAISFCDKFFKYTRKNKINSKLIKKSHEHFLDDAKIDENNYSSLYKLKNQSSLFLAIGNRLVKELKKEHDDVFSYLFQNSASKLYFEHKDLFKEELGN